MENKMTYVKALESAVNCEALPMEVREKLEALMVQQEKRNNAPKKPTKTQQANEVLMNEVLAVLAAEDKPMTVTEVMEKGANPAFTSNQKVSGLLTKLVAAGKVQRVEEKRKAYFSLVK